ncbi:MAG: hypothetical protein AB2L22_12845 [Syntrophales bacterium]
MSITRSDLDRVLAYARGVLIEIKSKYQGISGYLVFATPNGIKPWGQCEITEDIPSLMERKHDQEALRSMIHDSCYKEMSIKQLNLVREHEKIINNGCSRAEKQEAEMMITTARKHLSLDFGKLELREDVLIEIRFKELLYKEIYRLQKDPLVSQKYTSQTRASINIVLGTVGEILEKCNGSIFSGADES